uniref:Glycoside hydrolase family 76 protein n=1 Tax=Mycena chlorophos TaxID=658473 RepID=A0ABQ0KUW0_MYCCL|nr:glycoside hydrolase family 76 protein [Mycena chlorophos]
MLHLSVVLGLLASSAFAQDLGVPLSWREFSNSRPLSQRITIAQTAINQITPQLNSATGEFNGLGYWQSGNVWSVMANQDHSAGTTVNEALVINNLNLVWGRWSNYDQYGYNDDAMWWATAAIYAYRAYGNSQMLSHAEQTWNHVTNYVVTAADAAAGRNPNKPSVAIQSTCNGKTMAGAVFWQPAATSNAINSITTGLYTALSGFLYEYTGNSTYLSAAELSATWIQQHQLNANDLVLDTTNADCSTSPSSWLFTYNSGKYIEALSVLYGVTGNDSWNTLMVNILNAAVKTTAWQGSNGVITEGASPSSDNDDVGFKAILIRGLHEAWERNPTYTALTTLIHSYGDVQYNALLELAANGSTYSSSWLGPPQAFTSWGQLAALDVMTANIDTN